MTSLTLQRKSYNGLFVSLALVVGGISLVLQSDLIYRLAGALLLVLAAAGLVISILSIAGTHNALVLSKDGFRVMWLGICPQHWKIEWQDVDAFSVVSTQSPNVPGTSLPVGRLSTKMVGITFTPSKESKISSDQLKRMNHFRKYFDCDEILPSSLGMNPEALVLELNVWKTRAQSVH